MIKIGAVSRSFGGWTAEETANFMAEKGFSSTELCFSHKEAEVFTYNGYKDLSVLTDKIAADTVEAFRKKSIYIASIGVFSNLMEKDGTLLEKNIGMYARYIEIAKNNGIPAIATECGFVPGKRGIQADTYESDYNYFCESLKKVLEICEKNNIDLALESCVLDVIPSAKRLRDLILQIGSDRLKVMLDPANLIAASDEEDMFKYLAPYISYFHGKDRKVNDTYGRLLGDGDINWPLFFELYHKFTEGKPFILEYINAENCEDILKRALEFESRCR